MSNRRCEPSLPWPLLPWPRLPPHTVSSPLTAYSNLSGVVSGNTEGRYVGNFLHFVTELDIGLKKTRLFLF